MLWPEHRLAHSFGAARVAGIVPHRAFRHDLTYAVWTRKAISPPLWRVTYGRWMIPRWMAAVAACVRSATFGGETREEKPETGRRNQGQTERFRDNLPACQLSVMPRLARVKKPGTKKPGTDWTAPQK